MAMLLERRNGPCQLCYIDDDDQQFSIIMYTELALLSHV